MSIKWATPLEGGLSMGSKSHVIWGVGLVLLLLVAFLCLSAKVEAADKTEIVIGMPIPLTGGLAMGGSEQKWAYEQAVKDINAKGGIFVKQYKKKLPVRVVIADAESDGIQAAAALERLVKVNKVDLLLSTFTTNLVLPTSVAAEKLKVYVPQTTCLLEPWRQQRFQWSTLYFFDTAQAGEVPFQVLKTIPTPDRPTKLALLMEDSLDGRAFGPFFRVGAKKHNYEITVDEPLPVGVKDYSSLILKLKTKGIDGAILFAPSVDCVTFVRNLKEAGMSLKYLHGYKGTWAPDFYKALGKDAQYVLADGFWHENFPYPMAKELGARYKKETGKHSASIGLFYALAQQLFTAVEKAGTLDNAKVREAVLNTEFKGTAMGDTKYAPDGTAILQLCAYQWWNGELKVVYPFFKGGWQVKVAPSWNNR
jgi:branched-chain amino acid transport system substrate-binding protein